MPETYYPHLREVLDQSYADLGDSDLEAVFSSAFGEGVTPAEYEEFFAGLGRALRTAAPVLASAGQGALSGAAAGSALGPWGALGGALVGGVGSALAQHGRGPARDVGRVVSGVVGTAGALTGRSVPGVGPPVTGPAVGAGPPVGAPGPAPPVPAAPAPPGGVPAAAHLSALLADPRIAAALAMLLQGRNGTVPVGAAQTPVQASEVAGLVGSLALEAAAAWESADAVPDYLTDATGQAVVDPADPIQRAGRLLQLFGTEAELAGGGEEAAWAATEVWEGSDWDGEAWDEPLVVESLAGDLVGDVADWEVLEDAVWGETAPAVYAGEGAEVDDLYDGLAVAP